MTKADLVNVVANETRFIKKEVDEVVTATIDAIVNALKDGDKVQLIGFGTFEVKKTPEKKGRNPKTGEEIMIPESKKISFSASKVLKDEINSDEA